MVIDHYGTSYLYAGEGQPNGDKEFFIKKFWTYGGFYNTTLDLGISDVPYVASGQIAFNPLLDNTMQILHGTSSSFSPFQLSTLTFDPTIALRKYRAPALDLSANRTPDGVVLLWTNTSTPNFASIIVVRKQGAAPLNIEDGELVTYNIISSTYTDTDNFGQDYYYAVFSQSDGSLISDPVSISVPVSGPFPPVITATKAQPNSGEVTLEWTMPRGTDSFVLNQLKHGESPQTTPISLSSGQTSITLPLPLEEGTYTFSISGVNSYGTSDVASVDVSIDTTPPSSPSNVVATKVGASDNGSLIDIVWGSPSDAETYQVFVDDLNDDSDYYEISSGSITNQPIRHSRVADGSYQYYVYVLDELGNRSLAGISNAISVKLQPDLPTLTALQSSPTSNTVRLTWQSVTGSIGYALSQYTFFNESSTVISDQIDSATTEYLLENLPDDRYEFILVAKGYGDTRSVSANSDTVFVDTTGPAQPTVYAAIGELSTTVEITWDVVPGAQSFKLTRSLGSSTVGVSNNITSRVTIYDEALSNGTYTYHLIAFDEYGNASESGDVEITVSTPPSIWVSKLAPNSAYVTVNWDPFPGAVIYHLYSSINDGETTRVGGDIPNHANSYSWDGVADAVHHFSIEAVDANGNVSERSATVSVTVDTTAPAAPEIDSVSKPEPNASTINIQWTATEDTTRLALYHKYDSGEYDALSLNIEPSPAMFSHENLADGTHRYALYAFDEYGNTSNATTSDAIVVDTTPPGAPQISMATSNESTIDIEWENPEDAATISLWIKPSQGARELVVENELKTSISIPDMDDDSYAFTLVAVDAFGNQSTSVMAIVTVDAKPTIEKLMNRSEIKKGELDISEDISDAISNVQIGNRPGTATANVKALYTTAGSRLGVGSSSMGVMIIATVDARWNDTGSVSLGSNGGVGVVRQSNGRVDIAGSLVLGADFASTGNYSLSGGRLTTQRLVLGQDQGSGTFDWTGGRFSAAEVEGSLSNQGGTLYVLSDSPVHITGNYTQMAQATLAYELRATNQGLVASGQSLDDRRPLLRVTDGTTLSGTIQLVSAGYSPQIGDKIWLLDQSQISVSGLQAQSNSLTFDLPALDSRMQWDTSSFDTDGTIQVSGSSDKLMPSRPLNFPNPFKLSEGTTIGYWLNESVDLELRIYTARGSEVFRTDLSAGVDEGAKAGYNKIPITRGRLGGDLPAGIYPYIIIHSGSVIGKGRLVVVPSH